MYSHNTLPGNSVSLQQRQKYRPREQVYSAAAACRDTSLHSAGGRETAEMTSASVDDVIVTSAGRLMEVPTDRPPVPARRVTPKRVYMSDLWWAV